MGDLDAMPCPTCLVPCDVREMDDGWALRCLSCGYEAEGGGPAPTLRRMMADDGADDSLWDGVDLAAWTALVADAARSEPVAYSPTDPTTWTRAQLEAELLARMGLRAPDGWELVDRGNWWQNGHAYVSTRGPWWFHTAAPEHVENTSPTLTGPNGAFAQAELAAGVRDA
jgi:hypothetical protein